MLSEITKLNSENIVVSVATTRQTPETYSLLVQTCKRLSTILEKFSHWYLPSVSR